MTDETTQRLMPLLCFQCGMPINNKQTNFDQLLLAGMSPLDAFLQLDIRRACCRTMMNTAALDPRLRRRFHQRPGFTVIERASRLSAQVFTLGTDGCVEPLEEGKVATSTTAINAPSL